MGLLSCVVEVNSACLIVILDIFSILSELLVAELSCPPSTRVQCCLFVFLLQLALFAHKFKEFRG
jgi:hypothetical protein